MPKPTWLDVIVLIIIAGLCADFAPSKGSRGLDSARARFPDVRVRLDDSLECVDGIANGL